MLGEHDACLVRATLGRAQQFDRGSTHAVDRDVAFDQTIGVVVPPQLPAESIKRAVEADGSTRKRDGRRHPVAAIPEKGICQARPDADRLRRLGSRVWMYRRTGVHEAGNTVPDHLDAGQDRGAVVFVLGLRIPPPRIQVTTFLAR
jgi:hypothetical protein